MGIHNDETVESYKRKPILTMDERIKVLEGCKYIDKIIPNAPLNISDEFIKLHQIDVLFIPNNRTEKDMQLMYSAITDKSTLKIITIEYTYEISTTAIINRIKNL
jgi:glycerol-3-phosphate cytidylyltransferase-like family protein